MGKIWIAGQSFNCGARVVSWKDDPNWDATAEYCLSERRKDCGDGWRTPYGEKAKNTGRHRYWFRPRLGRTKTPPLAAAQAMIRQFVVHFDGCKDAKMCFKVLHDERGLSCHFLIDNDGTVYQTLDMALMGFHAAGFNPISVGVEFACRGDAKRWPGYYERYGMSREATTCRIHNHTYLAYKFTDEQLYAFKHLVTGLRHALPNVPLEYPQASPGRQAWTAIANPMAYSGYIGHYHQTKRKWDPGPFDFKKFIEGVRGRMCFPLFVGGGGGDKLDRCPVIPEKQEDLEEQTKQLYRLNEVKGSGGYFPVGPYGKDRLWHGGVHLRAKRGADVFASFPGRLIAARMGGKSAVGSTNFVLLRHDMTIGDASVRFFSLYFHLQDESKRDEDKRAKWTTTDSWQSHVQQSASKRKQTAHLDIPIEGGEVIGHVGMAGPDDLRTAQVHLEFFSHEEFMHAKIDSDPRWKVIDGTPGGRFSSNAEINKEIDSNADDQFSATELSDFYKSNPQRNLLRYYAVLHVSEWAPKPDWTESLRRSKEYANLSKEQLEELVEEQITPTLWWTKALARHALLPRDGVVYHYNPITFLHVVNQKILENMSAKDDGIGAFDVAEASETPDGVTDDFGDTSGDSFFSKSDLGDQTTVEDWPLERLVEGFVDE